MAAGNRGAELRGVFLAWSDCSGVSWQCNRTFVRKCALSMARTVKSVRRVEFDGKRVF